MDPAPPEIYTYRNPLSLHDALPICSRSGMASCEAPGKAEAVIAHFRRQAEAAGFKVNAEMKTGDTLMIAAGKPGDDKSGVQITATQEGGKVTGSITYGMGG